MASDGLPVERLREYLRELKPEARALLMVELDRARLRGDEVPAADLILQELRRTTPFLKGAPARLGDPARLFFAPFEPFLVDERASRKHAGRIARTSLEPIWRWISRDLMPIEAKAYSEQVSRLLLAGEAAPAEQLARAMQDRAIVRIEETLAALDTDLKARRRLVAQVGTPQALDDLREIVGVLKGREALALLGGRLPPQIRNLADEQLDNAKALLDSPIARHRDIFVYGLLLVMSRLGSPWHLIRVAVRAAESDKAARIAETSFAIAVTIVLDEIERLVAQLRRELGGLDVAAIAELLKDIHDGIRGLRTELDLSGDSPWARQLAGVRSEVSKLLEQDITSAPGRVRRLLRPRTAADTRGATRLDPNEVADVETLLELVNACRSYASELAINEATLRVHSELQNYLDTGMAALLDGLRATSGAERAFRQSQVDAAVRFAAKMFGTEYAALLSKAADVAAQGGDRAVRA
jgi:hypothetical protein